MADKWEERAVFFDWVRRHEKAKLMTRALFAEGAFRWNEKVRAGKSTPEQRENMEFARSWYIHNRHMKPGEAAESISHEIHRQFPQRERYARPRQYLAVAVVDHPGQYLRREGVYI